LRIGSRSLVSTNCPKNRGSGRSDVWSWSFPTQELRDEYLASADSRDEGEVRALLRAFLFSDVSFPGDSRFLEDITAEKVMRWLMLNT